MGVPIDSSDPASWDPALDAVVAAPENHKVIYEDELIRVVSVRNEPGATEKPHHHRFPSVFVIDRIVKFRDFNGATHEEIPAWKPDGAVLPIIRRLPPQPLHYVQNIDDKPFHGIRIEFKKGFPKAD